MVAHNPNNGEPDNKGLTESQIKNLFPDFETFTESESGSTHDVAKKARERIKPASPQRADTSKMHRVDTGASNRSKFPAKYLDESGASPQLIDTPAGILITGALLIDGAHFLILNRVHSFMIGYAYHDCIQVTFENAPGIAIQTLNYSILLGFATIVSGPDSKRAARYIARAPQYKKPSNIVWEGEIEVLNTYSVKDITPGRDLEFAEWNRHITVRAINRAGNVRQAEIPVMQFKQMAANQPFIDALDLTASNYVADLRNYITINRTLLAKDDGMAIRGMGPIRAGIFTSRSAVFDTNGNDLRESIRVDLSHIPDSFAYFDITPVAEIDDESIKLGIRELAVNYDECLTMPEIPAAFIGQIMTVPIAATYKEFFTAIFLAGIQGSGKTYYALRFDSVQSRTTRGQIKSISPILNLGITTGTIKGQQYRANDFAGFSITTDDVLKQNDSPQRIQERSDIVSNLIRSFLAGGGAIARVNRTKNTVGSADPPALKTCIKFTSEQSIKGNSTISRLVMLPFLTAEWSTGKVFNTEIAKRLASPGSRELQHVAWSAYVQWMYARIDELQFLLVAARELTESWGVSARVADSYAVLIAGNQMFARFASEHGISIDGQIIRAVEALHKCALAQEQTAIPMAAQFRDAIKAAAINHKLTFPGAPTFDPDGMQSANHSEPWLLTNDRQRTLPAGIDIGDLGLIVSGGNVAPDSRANVYGYLMPPRVTEKGGRTGDAITRKWRVVFRPDYFQELCTAISRDIHYSPDDVIRSLEEIDRGGRIRMRFDGKKNSERVIAIDAEWLFAREGDE